MKPFFSVVIPFYNNHQLFESTLKSLGNQIFKDFEVIIVHGRSEMELDSLLDRLELKLNYIFLLNDFEVPNANVSRNMGIRRAKGGYIAFLDSDDCWEKYRLQKAHDFIRDTNAKAVFSGCIINYSTYQMKRESRNLIPGESIFDFLVRQDTISQTSSMVVERDVASLVKFDENLNRHQDFDFFIRVNEVAPWKYFEDFSVIVNQNYQRSKPLAYEHCLPFYSKYHHLSEDRQIRYNYILWLVEKAAKENPNFEVSRFFRKKLEKENFKFSWRQKLLFNAPHLFGMLYRIKKEMI